MGATCMSCMSMRNFLYNSYCANREFPHDSLPCCIIKCRARRLSKLDLSVSWKTWHWSVSNICAFFVKERRPLTELWQSTEFKHDGSCRNVCFFLFDCVYTWMLSYPKTALARTIGIVRTIFVHGILYYRTIGYWAANLSPHNSYRTVSSASGAPPDILAET